LLTSVDEDEDLGPERETATDLPTAQPVTSPSIRRDADAAGSVGAGATKRIPKAVPVRRAEIFNQGGGAQQPAPSSAEETNQRKKGLLNRLFR